MFHHAIIDNTVFYLIWLFWYFPIENCHEAQYTQTRALLSWTLLHANFVSFLPAVLLFHSILYITNIVIVYNYISPVVNYIWLWTSMILCSCVDVGSAEHVDYHWLKFISGGRSRKPADELYWQMIAIACSKKCKRKHDRISRNCNVSNLIVHF